MWLEFSCVNLCNLRATKTPLGAAFDFGRHLNADSSYPNGSRLDQLLLIGDIRTAERVWALPVDWSIPCGKEQQGHEASNQQRYSDPRPEMGAVEMLADVLAPVLHCGNRMHFYHLPSTGLESNSRKTMNLSNDIF